LQFFKQNGQPIHGIAYSTRCGGVILSQDPSFLGAYPPLDGYIWPLLTKLAPPEA
jgi:hypothetical protein